MTTITVTGEEIIHLHALAEGFKHCFFDVAKVIFNQEENKETAESKYWWQGKDVMAVIGSNGVFALELYFKFLMVAKTYTIKKSSGYHIKGHNLVNLYSELKKIDSKFINILEQEFLKIEQESLINFLSICDKQYEDWRYSYSSGALSININQLCSILNILHEKSRDEIDSLAITASFSSGVSYNKSMTLDLSREIEEKW